MRTPARRFTGPAAGKASHFPLRWVRVLLWLAVMALAGGPSPLAAQDRPPSKKPIGQILRPPKRLPRDSAAARPGAAAADTSRPARIQELPVRLELDERGSSVQTYSWDRRALVSSGSLSLLDLLTEKVPGFTSLRASYFGGPHHLLDGLLGPGFVTVRIDGRELMPVEGAQVDLTRISLAYLDRVRVLRSATGWTIELTTLRHDRPTAYSRITAGTGLPDVQLIRAVFVNGLGRDLVVAMALDELDTSGAGLPTDRTDFQARVAWIPRDNRVGLELQIRNESFERTVLGFEDLDRREVVIHARGDLAPGFQAELNAATTDRLIDGTSAGKRRQASLALTAVGDRGSARARFEVHDRDEFPLISGRLDVGTRVGPGVAVHLSGQVARWNDFDTSEISGGVAVPLGLGVGLVVAAEGGTGTRGVSRPRSGSADSVSFDVASVAARAKLGPFQVSERFSFQRLSRQLPFSSSFDAQLVAGAEAESHSFETSIEGPVLPLGALIRGLHPLRVRGFWRHQTPTSGERPFLLPDDLVRGELAFHQTFFAGNLELKFAIALNHRGDILSSAIPGFLAGDPAALTPVAGYTFYDWNLLLRLLDFRVFWRVENLQSSAGEDVAGLAFPSNRNVVGVKWEFFN